MTTAALLFAFLGSALLQAQAQSYLSAVVAVETMKSEGKRAYYSPVNGDVVPQLRLTDEEALVACRNISGETTRVTAHPNTCSAFLTCFEYNGPNYGVVFIRPLSAGVFWSADNTNERAVPDATCSRNPCRTGRPISDGQNCFSYIACENNLSPSLRTKKCENGTSFSYAQAAINPSNPCVSDNTCYQYLPPTSRLVSCIPNGDLQKGVTNYSRTQELTFYDGRMETTTLNLTCPADTVLGDLANCTCVPSNNRMCPLVLAQNPASIRFDPASTTLVEIPALASNEIAGNFSLSFSFQASGSVAAAALVSNGRDTVNCREPSIEVYLDNNRVVASLRTVNSTASVTLTSNTLTTGSTATVTVQLSRNGNTAILTVNNNTPVTADIGAARLAKTYCGLSLGRGFPRSPFQGLIENLRMTLPCV